jgi:hypothetical protein
VSRAAVTDQSGQSTVEWIGLVVVVSLLVTLLGAIVGIGLPGAALADAIGSKIICAVGLGDGCSLGAGPLLTSYGDELAASVREHAPRIFYEDGMRALPVDYRDCRDDACADGADAGSVATTNAGEPVALFVHVVDCRPGAPSGVVPKAIDCSGERSGNVYLQYFAYYPGSATAEGSIAPDAIRELTGDATYHDDDWESFQVKLTPEGSFERASAHHGYGDGWVPDVGDYFVSGGSHAGHVFPSASDRYTDPDAITLIPLEPIAADDHGVSFAVTPPWKKRVWSDPEYEGTD